MSMILACVKTALLTIIAILFLTVAGIYVNEVYIYLSRSEASAKSYADQIFRSFCADEVIDPKRFSGPTIQTDRTGMWRVEQYHFKWTSSPDQVITIDITYFPYDHEVSGRLTTLTR